MIFFSGPTLLKKDMRLDSCGIQMSSPICLPQSISSIYEDNRSFWGSKFRLTTSPIAISIDIYISINLYFRLSIWSLTPRIFKYLHHRVCRSLSNRSMRITGHSQMQSFDCPAYFTAIYIDDIFLWTYTSEERYEIWLLRYPNVLINMSAAAYLIDLWWQQVILRFKVSTHYCFYSDLYRYIHLYKPILRVIDMKFDSWNLQISSPTCLPQPISSIYEDGRSW